MLGHAEGKAAPPLALQMAWDAMAFHSLPEAGGLRDQPAKLMREMRASLNVYHAASAWVREGQQPGNWAKWKRENPDLWEIVAEVRAYGNNQ